MIATSMGAIVIGASAGAVEALSAVLPRLPANFVLPIFVVVHLPADKRTVLPELFRQKCQMQVCEAEDKSEIKAGTIYFAPPDYHLLVESELFLSLSTEEPVNFSRPSIDVLFETAAEVYGSRLAGIILTGANNDGAFGLRRIADVGGLVVVQRPDRAYAATMPAAGLQACPTASLMTLEEIGEFVRGLGDRS